MLKPKPHILILYTGGTIGCFEDPSTRSLLPVEFAALHHFIPELNLIDATLEVRSINQPKDSSDMQPEDWRWIVKQIEQDYERVQGFVVLHGTDTMAYTASAVSFMIENLKKPVVFTGSQLPIGKIRTDGKENLITAIEIAAAYIQDEPVVPEVTIYFEHKLYRANRTFKYSAEHFNAYQSPNYPPLAEVGVHIDYHNSFISKLNTVPTAFYYELQNDIAIFPLFPGFSQRLAEHIFSLPTYAIILHTYGFGNGPILPWFFDLLAKANSDGVILLNITQCPQGAVQMGKYITSVELEKAGVISGLDMTLEAAIAKLMYLGGRYPKDTKRIKQALQQALRGELSLIKA